jgi:hypothetical protein
LRGKPSLTRHIHRTEIKRANPRQPGSGHACPNFYQMTFLPPHSSVVTQERGSACNDSNVATMAIGALPNTINDVDLAGTLALASHAPALHPLALRRAFSFPVPLGFRTVPVGGSLLPSDRDLTVWSSATSFPSLSIADIALAMSRQRMMCGPPQTHVLSGLHALQRADSASFPLLRAYLQGHYTTDGTTGDGGNLGPPFGL